jgi:hypothetical protein
LPFAVIDYIINLVLHDFRWIEWNIEKVEKHGCSVEEMVMAKKKISEYERFMALTDAEKDAEVAIYDTFPEGFPSKPLSGADKALHRVARAKGRIVARAAGRPIVGKGAKIVPVSIERGLLKQADSFAKRHKLKRSQMVAEGLRLVMQKAD